MSSVEFHVSSASVALVTRELDQVDRQIEIEGRAELKALGALVEHDIESRARMRIRNTTLPPKAGGPYPWSKMRMVVKPNVVYVVPQNKGTRGRGPRHRGRFDDLMWERAMYPAMRRHERELYSRFQALTDKVCKRFNHA